MHSEEFGAFGKLRATFKAGVTYYLCFLMDANDIPIPTKIGSTAEV